MLAFFILALVSFTRASDLETVRVSFSQKALNFASEIAQILFDVVKDEAPNKLDLPDIQESKLKLTNMHLESLSLDKPVVVSEPNIGLALTNVASLVISGDWAVKTGWWWTRGELTLDTEMTIESLVGVTERDGKFRTSPQGCDVQFNEFDLDLHNGFLSWAVGLFKGKITPTIRDAVCDQVNDALRYTANEMLASLPKTLPVADLFNVNIEADSDPVFASGLIKIPGRVSVMSQDADTEFPFSPEPMHSSMDVTYMACLLLSDYTVNTGSYIALPAGVVDYTVPNNDIDSSHPLFNTAYFQTILPELYTAYPDKALSLRMVNTRYPAVEFDLDEVFINMPVNIDVMVYGRSVMNLGVNLTINAALEHTNGVISGEVIGSTHTTSLLSTTLSGQISSEQLSDVVEAVLSQTLLPEVNLVIRKGIALPVHDTVLLNKGLIEAHDDFIKVCADISITDEGKEKLKELAEEMF